MFDVRAIRHWAPLLCAVLLLLGVSPAMAAPEGTLTFAMHFSPLPRWLDPAEGESTITPYLLLYAIHDGLLKPMPGTGSAPSLAESWSMAKAASARTSPCARAPSFTTVIPSPRRT